MTSEAPRHLCEPAADALVDDIVMIMKQTQTTDLLLSQQQVRVFTLCYAVLNDFVEVWNQRYTGSNQRTCTCMRQLFSISGNILLASTDSELSYQCVTLLSKLDQAFGDVHVATKSLTQKLMTLLYRSLRDAEELSCMESDCRRCARVVDWQVALIKSMQNSLEFRAALNRCDHKPVSLQTCKS